MTNGKDISYDCLMAEPVVKAARFGYRTVHGAIAVDHHGSAG
jgi:hypothetical protein